MKRQFNYIGCFFDYDELFRKTKCFRKQPLKNEIMFPHVTFAYRPTEVDTALFGETVRVKITGYGNNGSNEGFKVELSSDNAKISSLIEMIDVPHITLSISGKSKSVYTKDLEYCKICPIEIIGLFGGYIDGKVIVKK